MVSAGERSTERDPAKVTCHIYNLRVWRNQADAPDSKSGARKGVRVRFPLLAPCAKTEGSGTSSHQPEKPTCPKWTRWLSSIQHFWHRATRDPLSWNTLKTGSSRYRNRTDRVCPQRGKCGKVVFYYRIEDKQGQLSFRQWQSDDLEIEMLEWYYRDWDHNPESAVGVPNNWELGYKHASVA